MKRLNVALIGQQFMGRVHANAWRQAAKFFELPVQPRLERVVARDQDALAAFAERWEIASFDRDWRALAANQEVDLVDIATPNHLHCEQAIAMLEAGKHVACEKPLARNLAEARLMKDAAKKAKGKTFVWFNYRRCPAVALAQQLVADGKLGEIRHVRAQYLQSWGGPDTPMSWRFRKKTAGSGAHGDLNAHIVDMARFISGDEISIVHGAVARTFVKSRPTESGKSERSNVDDSLSFLASFKNGATGSFEASRVAIGHLNGNSIEVNGTLGSLRFDFEGMNVLQVCFADDDSGQEGWKRIMCTSADYHPYVGAYWPDGHVIGYEHGFINQAADIVKVLCGQEPLVPLPDFADAYETQRVLEAASISAREACAIKLSSLR